MRNYFKELKMNIQRIKKSKGEKMKTKEEKKKKSTNANNNES